MSRGRVTALFVGAQLVLAGCGSGAGASSLASAATPSAAALVASPTAVRAGTPPTSGSPAGSICRQTDDAGAVSVSIADFEFKPASIAARVGQVVTFSNTGFEPHNATVEAGCATGTLQTGESDGLVFTAPGTYKLGCTVHPWMTGTFTIAP